MTQLIPANPGLVAWIMDHDIEKLIAYRIEAWCSDGHPWVFDPIAQRLVIAADVAEDGVRYYGYYGGDQDT